MNKFHTGFPPLVAAFLGLALSASEAFAVDLQTPSLGSLTCTGNCGLTTGSAAVPISPIKDATFGYLSTFGGASGSGSLPDVGVGNVVALDPPTGSSLTSSSFTGAANTQFSISFNYVTLDGSGFSDYAWARLHKVGTQNYIWLFTAMSSSQGGNSVVPGESDLKKFFDPQDVIAGDVGFTSSTTNQIAWSPLGGSADCFADGGSVSKGCGSTGWLTSNYTFSSVTAGQYQLEMGVTNWSDNRFHTGLAFDVQGLALHAPEPSTFGLMGAAMALFGVKAWRARRRRD